MADSLFELLSPHWDAPEFTDGQNLVRPSLSDPTTTQYLNRITTLSISDLTENEPASLTQSAHSLSRSIQSLSKRSHKAITESATSLSDLSTELPNITQHAQDLKNSLPKLESKAAVFADKYKRTAGPDVPTNPVLLARKNALLLAENADRLSNVLDLPSLLSSAIASGQTQQIQQPAVFSPLTSTGTPTSPTPGQSPNTAAASSTISSSVNYGSALDLHAHVRRLAALYPNSPLVTSIAAQADKEMRQLTANLITALQIPGLKLAGAMRTVGWLRRVAPDLVSIDSDSQIPSTTKVSETLTSTSQSTDGALGALFLTCRLHSLKSQLNALSPLRALSDSETASRQSSTAKPTGQQTERYLKRYIEIFREQSFAIMSMHRSIFPSALPIPIDSEPTSTAKTAELLPRPSPLATFASHLADMLFETLKEYLPNVSDAQARESLLTQVLYCAGSLGRLGGDFGIRVALLEEDLNADATKEMEEEGWEWERVMKKHRVQASRLELLASGVATGAKTKEVTTAS